MKRKWLIGAFGLLMAFFLTACSNTGQVKSLSPEEMEKQVQNEEKLYVLINNTENKEERQEYINLVEENIENVNVQEINAKSNAMLNSGLAVEDVGLGGSSVFYSLSYYEEGELQKRISLDDRDFENESQKAEAIQQFIDETSS